MEYYLAIKNKDFLCFADKWMHLEIIILSEVLRPKRTYILTNKWILAKNKNWIGEKLEESEEEGNPVEGPAVSVNLDPWDHSNTEPPTRQHTPADMRP